MDKNKIIEAAAKLVAKGAYDKAIKEYQKILDADPKDVRILQKMGELYQKKNDNGQAAFYFTKVAESYSSDGFFLKAVALYKQVLKLDPSLVAVNLKLAELHQQLQLMSEAMAYYQVVANHYDKQGDTKSSLDTLRKMVDLDPDNIASRIKLAELYARENMNDEALGEFRRASEHLKKNNRADDYLRVAERISALEPQNFTLARELAEQYLARGDQKRALAKLQTCFKADARDIDTLKLLAVAFQGLGQTSKTISVYKELARVYQDKGRRDDADKIWKQIETLDPADADVAARKPAVVAAPAAAAPSRVSHAQAVTQAAPAAAPPPPASPKAAGPAAGPPRESLGKLLTETDVYVKYGLHDKALEHLRKVFAVDPENIDAHEKAYAIYVASNNASQAAEQLLNVLRLHTRRGDAQRAQPYLATILQSNPNHPEVPVFLAALKAGPQEEEAAPAPVEAADDGILVDSNEEEIIVADAPEDALAHEDLALRAAQGREDSTSGELITDDSLGDAALGEESLDETLHTDELSNDLGPPPVPDESLVNSSVASDFDAGAEESVIEEEPVTTESEVGSYTLDDEPAALEAAPPLGGDGEPETTSEMPAYELDTPADSVAGEAVTSEPVAEEESANLAAASDSFVSDEPVAEEAVEAPPEEELPAGEECEEASFFIDQGLWEEAREILETVLIAYPGHERASELMQRLEAAQAASDGGAAPAGDADSAGGADSEGVATGAGDEGSAERDAFDLAAELANELGEMESGAEQPSGEVPSADYQVSVDEVFSEFKKGLEKVVKPEDVDTHYDLGIAYKEMALIDDAISEFKVARQGCLGKKKEVDCLSMMGALQLMKGDHGAAIEAYKQALATEHATGEVEKALRYELAAAYEQANEAGRALSQYLKVQSLDGSYREVAAMVERLNAETTPQDDEPAPPPKKGPKGGGSAPAGARKVGYL